jgi:hypothetical protein
MADSNQWQRLLTLPQVGDHIVQVYQDPEFLTDAVCRFICAGLRQNDAIIVATDDTRRNAFAARLELDGFDVHYAMHRGQLMFLDASQILASFMRHGIIQTLKN